MPGSPTVKADLKTDKGIGKTSKFYPYKKQRIVFRSDFNI